MQMGLRGRVLVFFAATAAGCLSVLAVGLWMGYHRSVDPAVIDALLQMGVAAGFGLLSFIALMWLMFDRHIVRPIEDVASALRARTHALVIGDIDTPGAHHLGDLPAAASSAIASLTQARSNLFATVTRETSRLLADKSKLEQMLSDVAPAVLLCTGRHHLAFYNSVAQQSLSTPKIPVCLDRSLFDYLDDGAIRHAHQRLLEADMPDTIVEFVCSNPSGKRRLAGRMRLAGDNDGDAGAYVMTLRDVTEELAAFGRRDLLLNDVFAWARRAFATLQTLSDATVSETSNAPAGSRQELDALDGMMAELETRFEACRVDGWPMSLVDTRELTRQMQREFAAEGLALDVETDALAARCNAFDIVSLFTHLGRRVAGLHGPRQFRIGIAEQHEEAVLTLGWYGQGIERHDLEAWLSEVLHDDGPTAEKILRAHRTTVSLADSEGGASLSTRLRPIERLRPIAINLPRTVTYDFDLLSRVSYDRIHDARLDDLTYVVFDTETTGLLPDRGDELVQIAAVRIVNGRLVEGECFETLVNPGRPIPPTASAIHRVTDAMVVDAPGVLDVVERFHKFADNAVLVAHNAPFDMAFLYRREKELGIQFDHPILDTVHLSAIVFGQQETHTLDALAGRLTISLSQAERHTAMGDAVATAHAFLKLKSILMGRGIERFGDLQEQTLRHRRLVSNLNDRALKE